MERGKKNKKKGGKSFEIEWKEWGGIVREGEFGSEDDNGVGD